jgi:hypothetical protein
MNLETLQSRRQQLQAVPCGLTLECNCHDAEDGDILGSYGNAKFSSSQGASGRLGRRDANTLLLIPSSQNSLSKLI